MKHVEIKSQKRVFDDIFKIEEAHLQFERFDGEMSETVRYLNFERGDSAAAIILNTDTQQVILINQFRYPTYENGTGPGWITEIVAGMLEGDESPEEAIRREILEETGYQAFNVTPISTFYLSPGGSSEQIFLFYAEVNNQSKVAAGGGAESEREDIKIMTLSLPELWAALAEGRIIDAKSLIAVMWLRNKLKK